MFIRRTDFFYVVLLIVNISGVLAKNVCPTQCICDLENGLRRASCTHQNIINVEVGVPENVQIYDLESNSIRQLDDYRFENMGYKSLVKINLSNNKIFWVGLHALSSLVNLTSLNLSNNVIQALAPDIFWYNKQLTELDLSGNKFLSFKDKPFLSHSSLKILNLSQSQISHLPKTIFEELVNLTHLDLSKNFMIDIQIAVFKPLTNLKYLNLDENPWHCSENLKGLETWVLEKKIEYTTQCMKQDKRKKSEKMISMVSTDWEDTEKSQDLDELWEMETEKANVTNETVYTTTITFLEKYNAKFPSTWSLLIGFQLGILFGTLFTYCWMARLCSCRKIRYKIRRPPHRLTRVEEFPLWDSSMRIASNTETPPIARRQLSSPEAFCRSDSWEASSFQTFSPSTQIRRNHNLLTRNSQLRSSQVSLGCETPPPPYRECLQDRVIISIPE